MTIAGMDIPGERCFHREEASGDIQRPQLFYQLGTITASVHVWDD